MIVPDINLLVYAYNADAPRHQEAKEWVEATLNGPEAVGLPWAVGVLDPGPRHPDIVRRLAWQHVQWEKTLTPLAEIPAVRGDGPIIPSGHGWAFASANGDPE